MAPVAITVPPEMATSPSASSPPLASVKALNEITVPPEILIVPLESIPSPPDSM
ncbi:hypothetical protein D3C81_1305380 [compost metagenome]